MGEKSNCSQVGERLGKVMQKGFLAADPPNEDLHWSRCGEGEANGAQGASINHLRQLLSIKENICPERPRKSEADVHMWGTRGQQRGNGARRASFNHSKNKTFSQIQAFGKQEKIFLKSSNISGTRCLVRFINWLHRVGWGAWLGPVAAW